MFFIDIYIYIYTKYIHLNICSFTVDTHFKSSNVHHCCTTSRAKTSVKRIPRTDHPNLFRNYHKLPKLSQIFVLLEGVSRAQVVSSMPVPSHSYSSPPSKAMTEKNFPKPNPLHTQFKRLVPRTKKTNSNLMRWLGLLVRRVRRILTLRCQILTLFEISIDLTHGLRMKRRKPKVKVSVMNGFVWISAHIEFVRLLEYLNFARILWTPSHIYFFSSENLEPDLTS